MSSTPTISDKIIYWTATGLMLFLMLAAIVGYPLRWDTIGAEFQEMGFPSYIPYPLWALKVIGVVVIVTNKYDNLKNWVYATYFMNMLLALSAHWSNDTFFGHAVAGMVAIVVSYIYSNRVRGRPAEDIFILPARG
ncbi:MAG: DoxX family protein [Gammaproteobacteria bacterium]